MSSTARRSIFETHAQTALAVAITAGVIGAGTVLIQLRGDVEVMKAQLGYMTEQLKSAGDDRFRGSDWRREERVLLQHLDEHHRRIEKLENLHDMNGSHKSPIPK